MAVVDKQEVLSFDESKGVEQVTFGAPGLPTSVSVVPTDGSLARFLERPIRYLQGDWTTGDGELFDINPWQAFLFSTAVANKLQNYQYVRGRLHARLVVNGSPFHYGLLSLNYWPFRDDVSVCVDLSINKAVQLPHAFLNPAGGSSIELSLPFVNPRSFINLSAVNYTGEYARSTGLNMGRLICTEFVPLALANAAGATTVEWSLFLWMTDVELTMPTPYPLISQADEYTVEGVISKPATWVAGMANKLAGLPVIGRFARATEIGASAVASIASLFGFSRPVMLEDIRHFRPRLYGALAVTEGRDPVAKLTVDPKNEITVDPGTLGLESSDPLAIANITQREGVIGFFDWSGADGSGTTLASFPVTPMVCSGVDGAIVPAVRKISLTPVGYVSLPFRHWTGTLVYRFQFVCTQYHRGRIRVTYYPQNSAILPAVDVSNISWNKIIDLSETCDISFAVPWAQTYLWGITTLFPGDITDPASSWTLASATGNGFLHVEVINELRAPLDPSVVKVIVTMRAGDDFRVGVPETAGMNQYVFDGTDVRTNHPTDTFNFNVNTYTRTGAEPVVQADEKPVSILGSDFESLYAPLGNGEDFVACTFGESIISLRNLFKRSSLWQQTSSSVAAGIGAVSVSYSNFVYDVFSQQSIIPALGAETNRHTQINLHPISYFGPCFACSRGSVRIRVLVLTAPSAGGPTPVDTGAVSVGLARLTPATARFAAANSTYYPLCDPGSVTASILGRFGNGMEIWREDVQPGVSFEIPFYYPLKFYLPGAFSPTPQDVFGGTIMTGGGSQTVANVGLYKGFTATSRVVVCTFLSSGEDFSLDWFVCTPDLYAAAISSRQVETVA